MVVFKVLRGVRNHWKKSLFAAGAVSYGVSYAHEKYEINQLMRSYCEEASKYGEVTIHDAAVPPKRVLIILNPAANKKSAEKTYQKYCEPILHLAGYLVDVWKSEAIGDAVQYVEHLDKLPSAIIVAAGDGTLSETITGLLRRTKKEKCPVGILPVGRTNSVARKIFNIPPKPNGVEEVRGLADAAISIVRGKTSKRDVMEINQISEDVNVEPRKPIYAVNSLQWGVFRDAQSLRDKYWYVGPFREYAASLFNAFSNKLTWNCKAQINYTPPCPGCKNCYIKEPEPYQMTTGRWWSRFIPRFRVGEARTQVPEYSKIVNDNCTKITSTEVSPSELVLNIDSDRNLQQEVVSSSLRIQIGETIPSSFNFISESWSRIRTHKVDFKDEILARTIELIPEKAQSDSDEVFYSIDNEPYEVRPVKVKLVPKAIDMFTL